jgi:hypothetical protein
MYRAYFAPNSLDPTGKLTLGFSDDGGPSFGSCDLNVVTLKAWSISWTFSVGGKAASWREIGSGIIAQRITMHSNVTDCDGNQIFWEQDYDYTEFWDVDAGDVYPSNNDDWSFSSAGIQGTKGYAIINGSASFTREVRSHELSDLGAIVDVNSPAKRLQHVPRNPDVPMPDNGLEIWPEQNFNYGNTVDRSLVVYWNCCCDPVKDPQGYKL